jgi:outer membrane protein OmpA-like peptidoglycan-associated protein
MHKFQKLGLLLLAIAVMALSFSCNTSKRTKGAVIGGSAGGVLGGIIGKKSGNTATGVIIGSVIGGSAGAIIGDYMDKQSEEIEQQVEGAEVERVGEGIALTFDSGILFGFDSSTLTATSKANLRERADILKKYGDTDLEIDGHTDDRGTEAYNQTLSEKRASAVADYLKSLGVSNRRITTIGYGESSPVATNETDNGRAQNRRVEVAITANENLQERAQNGETINPN